MLSDHRRDRPPGLSVPPVFDLYYNLRTRTGEALGPASLLLPTWNTELKRFEEAQYTAFLLGSAATSPPPASTRSCLRLTCCGSNQSRARRCMVGTNIGNWF